MVTQPSDKERWIVSIEAQDFEFGMYVDALHKAKALLDAGIWWIHAKKGV